MLQLHLFHAVLHRLFLFALPVPVPSRLGANHRTKTSKDTRVTTACLIRHRGRMAFMGLVRRALSTFLLAAWRCRRMHHAMGRFATASAQPWQLGPTRY